MHPEPAAGTTDEDAASLARRRRAFRHVVEPEIAVLLRVGRSLTGSDTDAEDLVQETMILAFGAIDRFDGRHPRAWLLTILRNTHINRNRRRRPELLPDPDTQLERAAQVAADDDPARPDRFVDLEFDAELTRALDSLASPFAEVIELVDIGGLTYAEAARVAGIPEGTVMSRLHRARGRVRERLERHGDDAGRPR